LTTAVAPCLRLAAIATLAALCAASQAVEPPAPAALPMTGRDVDRLLRSRVSITLRAAPVCEAITKLAARTGLPLVIDRRVDRSRVADLPAREASLIETIAQLAAAVDARPVAWNGMLYIGPRQSGERLATLSRDRRRDVAGVGASQRGPYRAVSVATWERLAEPPTIVDGQLRAAGLILDNPGAIPHDLWDAGSLPPMSLADQLTILLVQFDLEWTPTKGGERVRVQPIAQRPTADR
jgi:hypothetical protein